MDRTLPEGTVANAPVTLDHGATADELASTEALKAYLDKSMPLQSDDERAANERVLVRLRTLLREWIREVCTSKGLPSDVIDAAGGKMCISGSYRLGVNEPGSDIDTVCVVPRHVTPDDFFGSFVDKLKVLPDVTELIPVRGARVPLVELVIAGIDIDLLFCQLAMTSIPDDLDILDNKVFVGVDTASQLSLNGPRATNVIAKLVPNYDTFRLTVRAVRMWFRRKGMYSNKLGFLGGINFNIMVTYVCQMFPNQTASKLLLVFFRLFEQWPWQTKALNLCTQIAEPSYLPMRNYKPEAYENQYHMMRIITPAYPTSNSSANVSWSTLQVMLDEFRKAKDKVDAILKETPAKQDWAQLFDASNFFLRYDCYLCVVVSCDAGDDPIAWVKLVEARMRLFVSYIERQRLPLLTIHPWPKRFVQDVVDDKHCFQFYIGLEVNRKSKAWIAMNKRLDLRYAIDAFRQKLANNMTGSRNILVQQVLWDSLPDDVLGEGLTREEARAARKAWRSQRRKEWEKVWGANQWSRTESGSSATAGGGAGGGAGAGAGAGAGDDDVDDDEGIPSSVAVGAAASATATTATTTAASTTAAATAAATTTNSSTTTATAVSSATPPTHPQPSGQFVSPELTAPGSALPPTSATPSLVSGLTPGMKVMGTNVRTGSPRVKRTSYAAALRKGMDGQPGAKKAPTVLGLAGGGGGSSGAAQGNGNAVAAPAARKKKRRRIKIDLNKRR